MIKTAGEYFVICFSIGIGTGLGLLCAYLVGMIITPLVERMGHPVRATGEPATSEASAS